MKRNAVIITFAAALVGILGSCAPAPMKPEDQVPLVWPEAPETPRIRFVRSFTRPDDFGIAKGFFGHLADILFGAGEQRLVYPMAVADVGGVVYVADPGAKGVHRFDRAAERYDLIGAGGGAGLPSPVGLATGSNGEVYVADSALAAVLVIRPGAPSAVRLPVTGLGQPTGIAFDPRTGWLYIVDTTAHQVKVIDREGLLHRTIGRRGDADGEFNYPTQISRDARGWLFVTDSLNFRIQIFDESGKFRAKFGQAGDGTGDFMRHKGVATDRHGHVYVVDALAGAFQIFDGSGRLLLSVGDLGHGRGEFWLPTGIFVGDDDMIYIADSFNRRIQQFQYLGGSR